MAFVILYCIRDHQAKDRLEEHLAFVRVKAELVDEVANGVVDFSEGPWPSPTHEVKHDGAVNAP